MGIGRGAILRYTRQMKTTPGSEKNVQDRGAQVSVANPPPPARASQIKLGLNVHADSVRVVRQLDHATPQPAQKFTHEQFLEWVAKQVKLAAKVYSCYEAGPFGYVLHRQLQALGIENVVIRNGVSPFFMILLCHFDPSAMTRVKNGRP